MSELVGVGDWIVWLFSKPETYTTSEVMCAQGPGQSTGPQPHRNQGHICICDVQIYIYIHNKPYRINLLYDITYLYLQG